MKKLLCILFLVLPFSNVESFYHVIPMEIPLFVALLAMPFFAKIDRFNLIDVFVLLYVLLYLVSVVVGADNLYKSAAIYRHMALSPGILYTVLRFGSRSILDLEKAMYYLVPGAVMQAFFLVLSFIQYGERDKNIFGITGLISAAVIISFAFFITLYGSNVKRSNGFQTLRWLIILILFGGLLATFTRAASVGALLMVIFLLFNWKSRWRRNLTGFCMQLALMGLLVFVFTGSVLFSDADMEVHEKREIQHTAGRLISIEVFMSDLKNRMVFWGVMTSTALENPILGNGAASRVIGNQGGTAFHLGSAHNILISSLMVAGIPGLLIFLLLVWGAYRTFRITPELVIRERPIAKVLLASFTVLLMVAVTNDLSAGRVFIWFAMLAMLSKLSNEREATKM